jgi:hypothetical protein
MALVIATMMAAIAASATVLTVVPVALCKTGNAEYQAGYQ